MINATESFLPTNEASAEAKEKLRKLEQDTNPFELKKMIETKLKIINKLLNQTEGASA